MAKRTQHRIDLARRLQPSPLTREVVRATQTLAANDRKPRTVRMESAAKDLDTAGEMLAGLAESCA